MRLDNLAALDSMTLAEFERELDKHTREIIEPDRWLLFNWSVSRHQMFATCLRQYYLNYYGARRVREVKNKAVSAVWWLKQVRPLKMWVGSVIHHVARLAISAHRDGVMISEADLIEEAARYYQDGVRASERGAKHDDQWVVLFEHVYPSDISFEIGEEAGAQVAALTRSLLESQAFDFIRSQPPNVILEVDEEYQSFELSGVGPRGSLTVFAIPDVLVRYGDDLYLIDWKTGDVEREGIRDQAGVYRLYAHQTYGVPEEVVHVIIADIGGGGESFEPPGGTPGIGEARQFIANSASAMLARLDDVNYNTAAIRDYPMTDDLSLCRTCGFKRACWRHG